MGLAALLEVGAVRVSARFHPEPRYGRTQAAGRLSPGWVEVDPFVGMDRGTPTGVRLARFSDHKVPGDGICQEPGHPDQLNASFS